jgi:hypothetical protein
MRAEVPYRRLVRTVRALRPYAAAGGMYGDGPRVLYLFGRGDRLTVAAGSVLEAAEVDLPSTDADNGCCAVTVESLIAALAAIRPSSRPQAATVVVLGDADGLQLSAIEGGSIRLPVQPTTPVDIQPSAESAVLVDAAPAGAACSLLTRVGAAAAADSSGLEELAAVRLVREAGACLLIEATDRRRIHRASYGEPEPTAVDAHMPLASLRRAVAVLTACDRTGALTIAADRYRIHWWTPAVRLTCHCSAGSYPDLERFRETVLEAAEATLVLDRAVTLAALAPTAALAAAGTLPVSIDPGPATAAVTVVGPREVELYRATVPGRHLTGPARSIRLNPVHARDALALLAGDTVTIRTLPTEWQPVYLESGTRHAILTQLRPA